MENWLEFIEQHFKNELPFAKFMDATLLHIAHGQAKIKIPLKPEYANTYGTTHGGIAAALVDMVSGVALRTLKLRIATVEISTSYFEPVELNEELIAEAQLVRQGSNLLYADVNIFKNENILVARGKTIHFIRGEETTEQCANIGAVTKQPRPENKTC